MTPRSSCHPASCACRTLLARVGHSLTKVLRKRLLRPGRAQPLTRSKRPPAMPSSLHATSNPRQLPEPTLRATSTHGSHWQPAARTYRVRRSTQHPTNNSNCPTCALTTVTPHLLSSAWHAISTHSSTQHPAAAGPTYRVQRLGRLHGQRIHPALEACAGADFDDVWRVHTCSKGGYW